MKQLSLILCALVALMVAAACGPSDPNTNGTGGHGSSTASITGTGGEGSTTSNGGGGTGGDANVCYVWAEDPFATSDPTCEACLCSVVPGVTDPAYCETMLGQGMDVCPAGGNTCEPGVSRCGYDLPPGQAYEWPDEACKFFVRGDTWRNENFNEYSWGNYPPYYDENGQYRVNEYLMSGRVLYYQMYKPQDAVGSSFCTFSADCKTMTCTNEPSGTIHMYWWVSHPIQ